ncbi:hypothetical protein G5V58_15245 [Nocardioides anomalus]|uniref:Uncharacterized protein n=1 Tax=Nocardioides anomalus TaxID=2712223 RepID=A0A6G6WFS6_9ACTN|nr:hypothetical protein [Nocardioides anomalus]QIG43945.1 hypothetical protein G5V58_15245 [Nocardioides anomalus]
MARTVPPGVHRPPTKIYLGTAVSVLVVAVCITWAFLSMRAVLAVGGSCADGGPYVSAQPCPDGAVLISIAIPVMLLTAMAGSALATSVDAPNLLIPLWAGLFGALGWNFMEYGVLGPDVVWGWLVCGAVFWLMAAPAVYAVLVAVHRAVVPAPRPSPQYDGARWWVPAYAVLSSAGALLGAWTWTALA